MVLREGVLASQMLLSDDDYDLEKTNEQHQSNEIQHNENFVLKTAFGRSFHTDTSRRRQWMSEKSYFQNLYRTRYKPISQSFAPSPLVEKPGHLCLIPLDEGPLVLHIRTIIKDIAPLICAIRVHCINSSLRCQYTQPRCP